MTHIGRAPQSRGILLIQHYSPNKLIEVKRANPEPCICLEEKQPPEFLSVRKSIHFCGAEDYSWCVVQSHIQSPKLLKKPSVREDPPVLFDLIDGLQEGEVVVNHEVGQDEGGRAAHSDYTVDQHTSWTRGKKRLEWADTGWVARRIKCRVWDVPGWQ